MKKYFKMLLALLCAVVFALPVLTGCDDNRDNNSDDTNVNPPSGTVTPPGGTTGEIVDYVSKVKLDMASKTKKQEVSVRLYVDGDTTHFNPVEKSELTGYNAADFAGTDGYIKARYIAVDTPESTGDVEKWGKTASLFTRSKLETAEKIIVESNEDSKWGFDSNGRYLVWVWYKPQGGTEFRNLNVEILQNGYAFGSSTGSSRYGEDALAALMQAQSQKIHLYAPASVKDENFYEGAAIPVTLKYLRYHLEDYIQKPIRVEGTVTAIMANGSFKTAYIEQYDEEDRRAYGLSVYLHTSTSAVDEVFTVGNLVNAVGVFTYYEGGGTYQISGIKANLLRPGEEDSRAIGKADSKFQEMTIDELATGTAAASFEVKSKDEDGNDVETMEDLSISMGEAVIASSISMKNLTVVSVYTTKEGDSKGAISLTCTQPGSSKKIVVRTTVLMENGKTVTEDRFKGKTINVKGIVDKYEDSYNDTPYQIKVHRLEWIEILN